MPGGSQYFFSLDKFPTSTSMQNFKVVALVVLEIKGVYNVHPPGPLRVAKSPVLLGFKSDGAGGLRLPITPICLAGMLIEAPGAEHCIFDYPVVSRSEEK